MSLPQFQQNRQIRQDWQRTMDTALEAGQVALLEWGASRYQLNQLPLLATYHRWNSNRGDVSQPIMLVEGLTAWPVPLLLAAADHVTSEEATVAPPVQFIYGGADQATYLAAMAAHAGRHLPVGAFYAVDVPMAMHPLPAPATQPHAYPAWHMLPLTLLFTACSGFAFRTYIDGSAVTNLGQFAPSDQARRRQSASGTPSSVMRMETHASAEMTFDDPWLVWSAFGLILTIILLALVI